MPARAGGPGTGLHESISPVALCVRAGGSLRADRRLPAAAAIRSRARVSSVAASSSRVLSASPPRLVFPRRLVLTTALGLPTRDCPPPFLLHAAAQIAPICNPLVRRHPVASHGPARLFHYHATPIISFPTSHYYSPSTLPIALAAALRTRDIASPRVRCLRSVRRFLHRLAGTVPLRHSSTSTSSTLPPSS